MTSWLTETPTATCPTCGVDCTPWRDEDPGFGPRDADEREAGILALALMTHKYAAHPVTVAVGDLVRYWSPWRGLILGSDVYRVDGIWERHDRHEYARHSGADIEPLIGTSYTLINPNRRDDRCFPFVGDPARPIVFDLVTEAPPAEVDLMDLLGWEFA